MPVELLIPFAVFAVFVAGGVAVVALTGRRRSALKARLVDIRTGGDTASAFADDAEQGPSALSQLLAKLGGLSALGGPSGKLRMQLTRAGYNQRGAAEVFFGVKIALIAVGLLVSTVVVFQLKVSMGMGVLLVMSGAALTSMVPNLILGQLTNKRTTEIREALPNAIDLLEVCVSAGMGVDQAWNATCDEIRDASGALADEMALTNFEILLGTARTEALKNMADRTGAEDLSSLASIITQADRFGTSMAEALRTFAETMREQRSQKAEECAEKMAIKLLLPMVIFIFPVVLIVSAGPAALKMMEMFAS